MKIKRFFSNDMRNVIRMVREELGADAVILSNSRVNGGVEVVAAVDYDESIFAQNAAPASKTASVDNTVALNNTDSQNNSDSQNNGISRKNTNSRNNTAPRNNTISSYDTVLASDTEIDAISQAPQQNPQRTANKAATPKTSLRGSQRDKLQPVQRKRIPAEFDELTDKQKQQSDFSFYLLEDEEQAPDTVRVSDTLFDASQADAFPNYLDDGVSQQGADEQKHQRKASASNSVWSQEPTLVDMRNEIRTLRDLLEKQLTGLAWGEVARNNPLRAKLIRQLLELDISAPLSNKIVDAVAKRFNNDQNSNAGKQNDYEKAWQTALTLLTRQLPTADDDLITQCGVVALVGPTGVGKTTTVAKLAARFALRHGRNNVALITTDSFRIAAHEQLRTYGRILGMPVRVASDKNELIDILKSFSDKDLVLIDTAGMSHRDMRLIEQFSLISDCAPSMKSLLVMSTTTHRAGLDEIVRVFRNVQLDGCVLTKLDETTSLGGALSVSIEHKIPVAYVSNGQKVPEDLHLARPHSLVNQSVLIARKSHQSLENESLELAFSRVMSNAYV